MKLAQFFHLYLHYSIHRIGKLLQPIQPIRSLRPIEPWLKIIFGGLLLTAALLTSQTVWPRSILDLDTQTQPVALSDWGDYSISTDARRTPENLSADDTTVWQVSNGKKLYPLSKGKVLWLRFTVPPAPDAERWYLQMPSTQVEKITVFTANSVGLWDAQSAGDLLAVNSWPLPSRYPIMPIKVSAEVPQRFLVRIENSRPIIAPLEFISEAYLSRTEQRSSLLLLGIFFGLAGLAVVISLLSAISLRDPAYGFYALSVAVSSLTQARRTGIAGLNLWPNQPWWNDVSSTLLPTLEMSAALLFISAVVAISERSRRLNLSLILMTVLGLFVALAMLQMPAKLRIDVFHAYIFLPQLLGAYALIWAWRRGDRFAPWLILGFTPMVLAEISILAKDAGLIASSELIIYSTQIGLALQLPIIMVVQMLRSAQRRENIRRISGLDRVDPETGLINGHVLSERLKRMISRSTRLKHTSAVLLIDIVNTEQIYREFGRQAAEELPLRVAERLLSIAREIDSAARLSTRRFGMLIEGPISSEEAASLGPRIVARCLMPYKGLQEDCVASVHIAYALVPQQGLDAQVLMARLDARLAAAVPGEKRAVFPLVEGLPELKKPRWKKIDLSDPSLAPESKEPEPLSEDLEANKFGPTRS